MIHYDEEKLNAALRDFFNTTGTNIKLLRNDISSIGCGFTANAYCTAIQSTQEGKLACCRSDMALLEKCRASGKAEMRICHAGLTDMAVPIIHDDTVMGYMILGQLKQEKDFEKIKERIAHLSHDTETMKRYYAELSFFDADKIKSVANLAVMLAKYVLFENMLKTAHGRDAEKAADFIKANLENRLTVGQIAKSVNISKNALYRLFRENFGCTIGEYINRQRIEASVKLLLNTDLTIEEISAKIGYSSGAYYAAVFKKYKGSPPLKFRKARTP